MKNLKKIMRSFLPKSFFSYRFRRKILLNEKKYKNASFTKIEKEINKEYKKKFGVNINWDNPINYTEKLNVSKLYGSTEIKTRLSDKVLVRDWVKDKIGEEYLIPIYGIYDRFDEIDFSKIPKSFVIKCNHDSGSAFICNDINHLNIADLKKRINFCMNRNYAFTTFEYHYKNIIPKIIIEKNMGDNIKDYKFLCFNGKPYYCWIDFDRFSNHKRNIYDMNWKLQDFNQMTYGNYSGSVPIPKKFSEMKKIVTILCKNFDHVRVDLYEIDGNIYFGEMTFTNGSGLEEIVPKEYDYYLGKLWDFDANLRKKYNNRD